MEEQKMGGLDLGVFFVFFGGGCGGKGGESFFVDANKVERQQNQ